MQRLDSMSRVADLCTTFTSNQNEVLSWSESLRQNHLQQNIVVCNYNATQVVMEFLQYVTLCYGI